MLITLSVIICIVAFLLLIGYFSQVQSTNAFVHEFPPKGQLVNVDGHQMHIYCTGKKIEGSPTVILDAGNGRTSLDWALVQPELSKYTHVCSFDRAGYGWSDISPNPRTGKNIVEEEKKMLEQAGVTSPYILVGHSGGGMYARIFAKYYPEQVTGIVLVDSAAVSADTFKPLEDVENAQWPQYYVMKTLATFGILPVLGTIVGDDVIPDFVQKLPQDVQAAYLASMARPSYFITMLAEGENLSKKDDEVWQELESQSLGSIPLIVLSAGATFSDNLTPQAKEINTYLSTTQKDLLKLSSKSTQVIAEKSSHDIHLDQPELVVQAVKDILQ